MMMFPPTQQRWPYPGAAMPGMMPPMPPARPMAPSQPPAMPAADAALSFDEPTFGAGKNGAPPTGATAKSAGLSKHEGRRLFLFAPLLLLPPALLAACGAEGGGAGGPAPSAGGATGAGGASGSNGGKPFDYNFVNGWVYQRMVTDIRGGQQQRRDLDPGVFNSVNSQLGSVDNQKLFWAVWLATLPGGYDKMYFSDAEIRSLRDSGHLGPQDVPYDLPTSAAAFRDLLNTMYKDDRTAILNGASYARMYYNNLVNGVEAPSKP